MSRWFAMGAPWLVLITGVVGGVGSLNHCVYGARLFV